MERPMIEIVDMTKQYRIGRIGGATLTADLQSWWARVRKKEDPNQPLFSGERLIGDTFMALNGVSFSVNKGEAVGIIGGNGAGKSTLLKILSRVTTPTSGSAVLRGRVASMLEVGTGFNSEMTGRENIYMNGTILGMSKAEIDGKIEEIIDFSECRDFIDTPVKRYSSGMYVKLAFAVSAHLDSEIMIMDEVLAVGDVKFQKKCLGKMSNSASQDGKTVLYVSHNMETVRQLCTRVIVLREGRVIFDGDVEEGIEVYCEESIKLSPVKTFTPGFKQRYNAYISYTEILNSQDGKIDAKSTLKVRVKWTSNINLVDVRFHCAINDIGKIVGISLSEEFGSTAGVENEHVFQIDTSVLTQGKYTCDLYIGHYSGGAFFDYGVQKDAITFQIVENENQQGIIWPASWGRIVLEKAAFLENAHEK